MSPSSSKSGTSYRGSSGKTGRETTHIGCECGSAFAANVHRSINIGDNPELLEQFYRGDLDRTECPDCSRTHVPKMPRTFHDPRLRMLILELPREFRHRELQLTAELLLKLDREGADIPAYAKRPRVAYGRNGLREILSREAQHSDPEAAEAQSLEMAAQQARLSAQRGTLEKKRDELKARRETLHRQADELASQRSELESERDHLRGLALDLAGRASTLGTPSGESLRAPTDERGCPKLAGRPTSEVDRWRAGDQALDAFLHDDRVFLIARPGRLTQQWASDPPVVRVQLHELGDGLLVTISASPAAAPDEAGGTLFWPLDPRDAPQRAILERLGERFEISLDIYDEESRPVASWTLQRPLSDNVAAALQRADAVIRRTGDGDVPLASLLTAFDALGSQRLCKQDPFLRAESFSDLASPGATALALGVITHWSAPVNETRLLFSLCFPAAHWVALRRRVVRRAVDFGLHLPPPLADWALSEGLAKSGAALLEEMVRNFRAVCRDELPNDLDPLSQWRNWRELLLACIDAGVPVNTQNQALFRQSARRARQLVRALDADPEDDEADLAALDTADQASLPEDEQDVGDLDIVDELAIDEDQLSNDVLLDSPASSRSRTMEVREEDILERESSEPPGD